MVRRGTGAIGLTAVEVALTLLVLVAVFSLGTWILKNQLRRELTNRVISYPNEVFDMECRYLDEPDRSHSILCTISNSTRHSLPFLYRENSFVEQRPGESYDGLPITERSASWEDVRAAVLRTNIPARGSAEFTLFSEFPLRRTDLIVGFTPIDQRPTVDMSIDPGLSPSERMERIAYLHSPRVLELKFDERWLTYELERSKNPE